MLHNGKINIKGWGPYIALCDQLGTRWSYRGIDHKVCNLGYWVLLLGIKNLKESHSVSQDIDANHKVFGSTCPSNLPKHPVKLGS